MVLKRGYVTLLYTVRYGSHTVHRENYAVLAVRCKFQDSVFLRLTVRCDTVRYGNLLQYYNTVYTTGYTANKGGVQIGKTHTRCEAGRIHTQCDRSACL